MSNAFPWRSGGLDVGVKKLAFKGNCEGEGEERGGVVSRSVLGNATSPT